MARSVLFTTQRNEGPFLLEWIAFHRLIGFDHFVIVSNDCTDGSDTLLDVLSQSIGLTHLRQDVPVGQNAQVLGQQKARETGAFKDGDWVAWMDLDEFLNIRLGDGTLPELIARLGPASAICVNWRLFGSAGVQKWPGLQLDRKFNRCGTRWHKAAKYCKTLFRFDDSIVDMTVHRPVLSDGVKSPLWLDTNGGPLPQKFITCRRANSLPYYRTPQSPRYRWAQVNHYMVRTRQLFVHRRGRGRGSKVGVFGRSEGSRYTWWHYQKHNCNILRDSSIHRHLPGLQNEIEKLLADTAVSSAFATCLEASGLQAQSIDLWNLNGDAFGGKDSEEAADGSFRTGTVER
ncbi:MAG: glycosyltransferase family 2 protein [Pseudomonadota bacterium]